MKAERGCLRKERAGKPKAPQGFPAALFWMMAISGFSGISSRGFLWGLSYKSAYCRASVERAARNRCGRLPFVGWAV